MTQPEAPATVHEIPRVVTEIANRAAIRVMNLMQCRCELVGMLAPGETIPELKLALRGGGKPHGTEAGVFVCTFGVNVIAIGPKPAARQIARFSCDYAVQYEIPDEAFLKALQPHDLELFAAYNASFHVWPYVRELIHSMSLRMGIPPVTVPLFRSLEMIGPPEKWTKRAEAEPELH